ncbi:MAG: ATP-binding protein [Candidatus Thiodiazotropha lotti]|nr:ATP-binding protein [Candidatus Thiodiazotropha lotti]
MSKRFLSFTLLSLVGMTVVTIMLIVVFRDINQTTLEGHFHEHNVLLARILRNDLMNERLPRTFLDEAEGNENARLISLFETNLKKYLKDLHIAKIKIFDLGGITIYSSTPGEAGRDASKNPGVFGALNGLSSGSMVYRDKFNSFDGMIEKRNLYQQYIPIHGLMDDRIEGVFEIYSDVTPFLRAVTETERKFFVGLLAVLGTFLLAQIWLYHRTDSALVKEQAQTVQYLRELENHRTDLESRVVARTEELESSHYFLQSVIDGIANPLFVIKKDLNISLMNKAAKGLINVNTPKEKMTHCYQISHRRDTPCTGKDHPCSFQEVMRSQSTATVQHKHYDADDNPIIVDVISTPFYDKGGELQGIIEVQHDVSELVHAKQNLAQSEARLQAILDHIPDAIFTLDNTGRVESANMAALGMFNYMQGEMNGKSFESLFSEDREVLLKTTNQGENEYCAQKQGDKLFPVDLWVGDLQLGQEKRLVAVVRDISESKKAAQELERTRQQYFHQEKMAAIGQLAAGILHEVGNPIAAIAGAADDMRSVSGWKGQQSGEPIDFPQVVSRNLQMIEEHTERLSKITRDIADFASPRIRNRDLTDINGLIRSTTRLLGYDHRYRKMEIIQTFDNQLPAVEAVPDQITQVLVNLIINGLDACNTDNQQPTVEVITRVAKNGIEIEIKDNGSGMDEQTLEHALEPFFTTKEPGKGTGLGLSLCNSIVSEHNGKLHIESHPGAGTSAIVFLPVSETHSENNV